MFSALKKVIFSIIRSFFVLVVQIDIINYDKDVTIRHIDVMTKEITVRFR